MSTRRMLKFELFDLSERGFEDTVTLEVPPSNGMEQVGLQGGRVMLWQLCDDTQRPRRRAFHIAGTGHVLPTGNLRFLGTVFEGPFVWHLFEVMHA